MTRVPGRRVPGRDVSLAVLLGASLVSVVACSSGRSSAPPITPAADSSGATSTVTSTTSSTGATSSTATSSSTPATTAASTSTPAVTTSPATTAKPPATTTKPSTSTTPTTARPGPTTTALLPAGQVEIADFTFVRQVTTVPKGSTVTWENADATQHTVSDLNGVLASGPLDPGATYSHRFDTPGTYSYFCNFHSFMTGQVVVTG